MGLFAKGSIVLVPYPFSDLSGTKLRPALVLAEVSFNDYVFCQITTKPYGAKHVVPIKPELNPQSGLHALSYLRPEKVFTGNENLILEQIGVLEERTVEEVVDSITAILRSGR